MTQSANSRRFDVNPTLSFRKRLKEINEKIAKICDEVGRSQDSVRLLPVSKTVPAGILRHAYEAGMSCFAENKVQEALAKSEELSDIPVKWSMVGHLQRNKAKIVAKFASEFHALDSIRLAESLNRHLEQESRQLESFVQVNTSGESSKYGLSPEEVADFLDRLQEFEWLKVRGLMTLAVFSDNKPKVRACFQLLRNLRDSVSDRHPEAKYLSMGMSGDFEDAIREGADVVRIGQGIFGARPTPDEFYWPGGV